MPAPTNRPFFANFLSAFRARSNPTFKASSSTGPSSPGSTGLNTSTFTTTTTSHSQTATPSTAARAITKPSSTQSNHTTDPIQTSAGPTTSQAAVPQSTAHLHATSALARSPGVSTPLSNFGMSPPPGASTPLRGRQRRGSDDSSSSGGFRDALGSEKWYIGGRTATGEERFYRLGLISPAPQGRQRSLDRLSL